MASEELKIAFRVIGKTERVPVCFCDPDGDFQAWFDRYLSLDGSSLFCWQTADAAAGNCRPRTRRPGHLQTFPFHGEWDGNSYEYLASYPERTGYWDERRPITPQVGLPVINWPAPPKIKINSLWWPTGATRWAVGLFLLTEENLRKVCDRDTFVIGLEHSLFPTTDRKETKHTISVYPMTPRRVTAAKGGSDLWLLPVVDSRYFWQFMPWRKTAAWYGSSETPDHSFIEYIGGDYPAVANDKADPRDAWKSLFGQILLCLGFGSGDSPDIVSDSIPSSTDTSYAGWMDTIPETYRYPDFLEFQRKGVSAAYVLDAAAASIGKRVVVCPQSPFSNPGHHFDGPNIWIIGPARSKILHAENIAANRSKLIAGGCAALDWSTATSADSKFFRFDAAERPRVVSVFFPSHSSHGQFGEGEYPVAEDTGLAVRVQELADGTFHVDWNSVSGSLLDEGYYPTAATEPRNRFAAQKVFLDSASYAGKNLPLFTDLALQIAADYRDAQGYTFDVCYSGIRAWRPSGFDDFVEYNFGVFDGSEDYICTTRAASLPPNCGVSHQLHLVDVTDTVDTDESNASDVSSGGESSQSGVSSASSYSGPKQVITVVTGVWCDDGDIVIQTTDLVFDAAGHFLYTENVDPPA